MTLRTTVLCAVVFGGAVLGMGPAAASPVSTTSGGLQWSTMNGPTPPVPANGLAAISCTGARFCLSVGPLYTGFSGTALAEEWDGSGWVPVTVPGGSGEALWGLSCLSRNFCMAVGGTAPSEGEGPGSGVPESSVAYEWDGSSWTELSTPSDPEGLLEGVSCVSTTNCEAVGWSEGSSEGALTERWHGGSWSVVANPESDSGANLVGVSCVSKSFCVAVGLGGTAGSSLMEQWDGTQWTDMTGPSVAPDADVYPLAVSCSSVSLCVAVGQYADDSSSSTLALVDSWDGRDWTMTPTALSGPDQILQGVDCYAPKLCRASGDVGAAGVVVKWKPKGIVVDNAPEPGAEGAAWLGAISCVNGWACVTGGGVTQTDGSDTTFFSEAPIAQSGSRG